VNFGFDLGVAAAGQAHFELTSCADLEMRARWVAEGAE